VSKPSIITTFGRGYSLNSGLGIYGLLTIFGIILAVVWIILPFAIFGTKPLLHKLLVEQRETNRLLAILSKKSAPQDEGGPAIFRDDSLHS
jgi:ABC-type sulfate transport system permease component